MPLTAWGRRGAWAGLVIAGLGVVGGCTLGGETPSPSPSESTPGPGPTPTEAPDPTAGPNPIRLVYDFEDLDDGWVADFTDFGAGTGPQDVVVEAGVAPPGLDGGRRDYLHVAATNRSDDLFAYLRRQVDVGLQPTTGYRVSFAVTFASNAPSGCVGVGGAPGESVWVKVGASPEQPEPVTVDGETRLSVDKGNQSSGGRFAGVAGVVANGIRCEEALDQVPTPYAEVTLRHALALPVTTDDDGAVWLFVGTDSGFESRTSVYYDRIEVTLTPVG